jgi:hypothetical protein
MYYDIYVEHLTLSRKKFANYEIWISPYGANNQSKAQKCMEKQWLSIYWFHTNTSIKNYVVVHIGIWNMNY